MAGLTGRGQRVGSGMLVEFLCLAISPPEIAEGNHNILKGKSVTRSHGLRKNRWTKTVMIYEVYSYLGGGNDQIHRRSRAITTATVEVTNGCLRWTARSCERVEGELPDPVDWEARCILDGKTA